MHRFAKRCKDVDIWIRSLFKSCIISSYKPSIRKACDEIVKTSGTEIAHILVDKNNEVDTDIMNCITLLFSFILLDLTRVVCMGLNRLCTIRYLNLDARSVNSRCENCVNIARLFEFQTRRASRKFIARGMFFDSMLESTCERIPFYYSRICIQFNSLVDPSKIGSLCEELVSDYDEQIVDVLQKFADGAKENVEESLCVDIAHACSKKEYKRVGK